MADVTVWTAVAWLFGAFGLIMGLISSVRNPIVGIPMVLAGLVVLPPGRGRLEGMMDAELTDWLVIGIYCSLFAVSVFFFYMFQG